MKIQVENIKCGGCMNSIKTALLKIDRVQEVTIDKDTETVHVSGSDSLDREALVQQLAKMGYPEKGNNNILHKAKSYVSCAVGNLTSKE
jgi:copper chaperone CopZ